MKRKYYRRPYQRSATMYGRAATALLLLCLLGGCIPTIEAKPPKPDYFRYEDSLQLADLAFSRRKEARYKVQIEEDGELVPYLVLTDDYSGNCLLLREHLMDEERRYGPPREYAAYYGDSEIDSYLNEEFLERFPEEVREHIVDSTIEITAKESLGTGEERIITIIRKVFFLSATEIGDRGSRTTPVEGKALEYFYNSAARIASFKDGEACSWWIRTANTSDYNLAGGVAKEGWVGGGGIYGPGFSYENGVRPAFCLKGDIRIQKQGEFYVLVLE